MTLRTFVKKTHRAPERRQFDETLLVTGLHPSGAGLARSEHGSAVLVAGALPGDRVALRWTEPAPGGRFGLADSFEILEESAHRVDPEHPRCALAGRCGGCPLARVDYATELELKTKALVVDTLEEAGFEAARVLRPALGHDVAKSEGFRNKAILYPVDLTENGETQRRFGFFEARSHRVVPAEDCPQSPDWMKRTARALAEATLAAGLELYDETSGTGVLRALLMRDGARFGSVEPSSDIRGLAVLVVTDFPPEGAAEFERIAQTLVAALPEGVSLVAHRNARPGNALLSFEPGASTVLCGRGAVDADLFGLTFEVRPETFLQVNTLQTPVLYGAAVDALHLSPGDAVLDLYCGVGTISSVLARAVGPEGRVTGVKLVEASVEAARANAKRNDLANVRFEAGPVETVLPRLALERAPTKAVLDPAFKGLAESVPAVLAQLPITDLVYVSCNPKTLVRDVKRLAAFGFELESVTPVDLFPGAFHLEAVAVLRRSGVEGS